MVYVGKNEQRRTYETLDFSRNFFSFLLAVVNHAVHHQKIVQSKIGSVDFSKLCQNDLS